MGNGHHIRIIGRLDEPSWPVVPSLTDDQRKLLALYVVTNQIDPHDLICLDEQHRAIILKRKHYGVFRDGQLVGVVRHVFPSADTKIYTMSGHHQTVFNGACGQDLSDLSVSLLALHFALERYNRVSHADAASGSFVSR
jgi:hypothetical protein